MVYGIKDEGEQDILSAYMGTGGTLYVGLYNDATDNVGDSGSMSSITTEPSGYTRVSDAMSNWTQGTEGGATVYTLSSLSFDTSGVSGDPVDVDSYFITDSSGGSGSLIATGELQDGGSPVTKNVGTSGADTLNVSQVGFGMD
jgi:hypothetical protein